jgi:hypothetical protein
MKEQLKVEYVRYLKQHGLKPRKLPPKAEREAGEREMVSRMYEEALAHDDPFAAGILVAYERNRFRDLEETRHPAAVELEQTAAEVEVTIRALPGFAQRFHDEVFVGEFPTGSLNGEAVKVDGGYLVLVNSGTLTTLQMVVTYLWGGNPDDPNSPESVSVADHVAELLATYIEYGDAFYGPRPVAGGLPAMGGSLMTAAARKFAVAHEYGHILGGHLSGALGVLGSDHAQEYEADDIGYRLTLGVARTEDVDVALIDAGASATDDERWLAGLRQKCLIAAPFVLLTIDAMLDRFYKAARQAGRDIGPRDDHPSAEERIGRLLARCPGNGPHHSGFINFPFMLLPHANRIVERMADRILGGKPDSRLTGKSDRPKHDTRDEWLDDIMRSVDAIRQGDYAAATSELIGAFARQQTILESEEGVVVRGVLRIALGQSVDLRAVILERQRERIGIEQFVKSANANPLLPPHRIVPNASRFSLEQVAELVPGQKPKGLELVQAVLDEEIGRCSQSGAGPHLLAAVLSAWRANRGQMVSSLESALAAGVADPSQRLARFVALEKTAMRLDVLLDTQTLLRAVGLKAVTDEKRAAAELAALVKAYVEYLDVPLGPVAQRMIEAQLSD